MKLLMKLWRRLFIKVKSTESLTEHSKRWIEELNRAEEQRKRDAAIDAEWRVMG
jgi:hypothetical protein